ncbi:VOC family protein [Hymenobacter sp. B81]|uniref:VOC family protein n=1 Tax=Hymenobacter sp. B81 TaxID=3344878 RepID=UPI0037DCB4CF
MELHHLFIFTDDQGQVADELLALGFAEGSRRVHPGQGTANRKFYFENGYLEVLWVHNAAELDSAPVRAVGLGLRARPQDTGYSLLGLCVVRDAASDRLFTGAQHYQPEYFPPGLAIDVLPNTDHPTLPWTFRLPFPGQTPHDAEPLQHPNGVARLTGTVFEYSGAGSRHYLECFAAAGSLAFVPAAREWVILTFDNGRQGQQRTVERLCLTLRY